MSKENEIMVNSILSLLYYMKSKDLSVEWQVLSDIGPDWIRSERKISFYLGDIRLRESDFHSALKNILIEVVGIPATSDAEIIDGEGNITLENNTLKIKYWWTKTIPYQYSEHGGRGTATLWKLG